MRRPHRGLFLAWLVMGVVSLVGLQWMAEDGASWLAPWAFTGFLLLTGALAAVPWAWFRAFRLMKLVVQRTIERQASP